MTAEYEISSDAPHSIIISGEGSFLPFIDHMGGKIVEQIDERWCEIPFTQENAQKLRTFLVGKDFVLPGREKLTLRALADHPELLNDPDLRWRVKLTDLIDTKVKSSRKLKGIETDWDLIHYLPFRYLDKTNPQSVDQLIVDAWATVIGRIVLIELNRSQKGVDYVKVVVEDVKGGRISASFFNQTWLMNVYRRDDIVALYGNYNEKVFKGRKTAQIISAKMDKITSEQDVNNLGMIPLYPQRAQTVTTAIQTAQKKLMDNIVWIDDPVPERLLTKYGLMSRTDAYKKIHFPNTMEDVLGSRRRIAFDEFVRLQLFLLQKKTSLEERFAPPKNGEVWPKQFIDSLAFDFTSAQNRVVDEILGDMNTSHPMNRLLQGDVGSGKALPLNAAVLTPEGFKRMGDMKAGQQVLTPNGGIATVTHYFPQGKRPIYEFVFEDGSKAQADIEHLWKVNEHLSGESEPFTSALLTTEQILKKGLRSYGGNDLRWSVPEPKFDALNSVLKTSVDKVQKDFKRIVSVTYVGIELAACIKISDPAGLFITNHYTVTHNTEISSVATLATLESGYQVALLAPTDILATQLFERLTKTFAKAGFSSEQANVGIITGRVLGKKRAQLLEDVKNGVVNVLVGTHAILQKNVVFKNLGLVIVDEQHKFGTEHRNVLLKLNSDGSIPDMLSMSATPAPRTTAQIVYGDMDISIINELPAERIPIETVWEPTASLAWARIREEVDKGHQAYVVASLVEESDKLEDVEAATETYNELQNVIFPDKRIGLLHGKLSRKDKQEVIDKFYKNEIDILVATTVVEVGVNVPNATVMTILNANRFGMASLHQIRGRVGRGAFKSYCYLIGEATVPDAEVRLNSLVFSNDGFWLAEKDLDIRGEGELFGQLQSGASGNYIGNLREHKDLLELAKIVAKQASSSEILKLEVNRLYKDKIIKA